MAEPGSHCSANESCWQVRWGRSFFARPRSAGEACSFRRALATHPTSPAYSMQGFAPPEEALFSPCRYPSRHPLEGPAMLPNNLNELPPTPGQEPPPFFARCSVNPYPREQASASMVPRRQQRGWSWVLNLLIVLLFLANGVLFMLDHFLYVVWLQGSFPVRGHPTIALITEDGQVSVETANTQQVSFEARKYAGSSCNFPT